MGNNFNLREEMTEGHRRAFSPSDRAIVALVEYPPRGESEALYLLLDAIKASTDARHGFLDSVFLGFLGFAALIPCERRIREVGARLRTLVAAEIKLAVHTSDEQLLPVSKVQEWDYSTASVYAKLVSDMLMASRTHPSIWATAMRQTAENPGRASAAIHAATGFFMSKSLCRKALDAYSALVRSLDHEIIFPSDFLSQQQLDECCDLLGRLSGVIKQVALIEPKIGHMKNILTMAHEYAAEFRKEMKRGLSPADAALAVEAQFSQNSAMGKSKKDL